MRLQLMNKHLSQAPILTAVFLTLAAPALAERGGTVVQKGAATTMGGGNVLLGSNGLKAWGGKGRIVMLMSGPNWTMSIVNNRDRLIYQTTMAKWFESMEKTRKPSFLQGATWKRGASAKIAGLRAYEFVMDRPPAQQVTKTIRGRTLPPVTAASLWVAQDVPTSPSVSKVFARMYGIPDCQRLPLRLSTVSNGQSTVRLDTLSATATAVTAESFQPPQGYKKAKSYIEAFTGLDDDADIEDLLQK